jgi:hypothetical protein
MSSEKAIFRQGRWIAQKERLKDKKTDKDARARWVDLGLLPLNYKYERGDVRPGEMIFRFYRCWRKWVENKSRSPTENEKHWCTELCTGFLALKAVEIEDEAESEPYGYSLWEPIDSDWDDTDDGGEFAEGSDDDDDDESCN